MAPPRQPPVAATTEPPPPTDTATPTGVAAVVGTGAAVGTTLAPAAAGTAAAALTAEAIRKATANILGAFGRFATQRQEVWIEVLPTRVQRRFPERTPEEVNTLVREERERERAFQRKARVRLERDLPRALRTADPARRVEKVQRILDRERRYLTQREEAVAERAYTRMEMIDLERLSPQGAFWKLSEGVRQHTPGCLAMGNKFWPWPVLHLIHPQLHAGCACHLYTLDQATERGFMTEAQVPDAKDAMRRAKKVIARLSDIYETATPEEIDAFLEEVEDGVWAEEAFYGRQVGERYAAGTTKGGQFRPRRGARPGRPTIRGKIRRSLRKLVPDLPTTPAQGARARDGDWMWMRGNFVFVPRDREFKRVIDGVEFTSPAGSGNIYRNGYLVHIPGEKPPWHNDLDKPSVVDARKVPSTPKMQEPLPTKRREAIDRATAEIHNAEFERIHQRVVAAVENQDGEHQPVKIGDTTATAIEVMRGNAFQPVQVTTIERYDEEGRQAALAVMRHESGAEVDVISAGGKVIDWNWRPTTEAEGHVPMPDSISNIGEFRQALAALAEETADRYGKPAPHLVAISRDPLTDDHAGYYSQRAGVIVVGVDSFKALDTYFDAKREDRPLTNYEAGDLWAGLATSVHEAMHAADNVPAGLYAYPDYKAFEEALNEEWARVETARLAERLGITEALQFQADFPENVYSRGSYGYYRQTLDQLLSNAKVAPEEREEFIENLRFNVPREDRNRLIAERMVQGATADYFPQLLPRPPWAEPDEPEQTLEDRIAEAKRMVEVALTRSEERRDKRQFDPLLALDLTQQPSAPEVNGVPVVPGALATVALEPRDEAGAREEVSGVIRRVMPTPTTFLTDVDLGDGRSVMVVPDNLVHVDGEPRSFEHAGQTFRVGDTIRYDHRLDGGYSTAVIERVEPTDRPGAWVAHARTTDDSLNPGKLVRLTPERINGTLLAPRAEPPAPRVPGEPQRVPDAVRSTGIPEADRMPEVLRALGLPDDLEIRDEGLRALLANGRVDVQVFPHRDEYGQSAWSLVYGRPRSDRFQEVVLPKDRDRLEEGGARAAAAPHFFDPEIAEIANPDSQDKYGPDAMMVRPKADAGERFLQDLAPSEEGFMYRGMSGEEYEAIQRSGIVQSIGDYNLGTEQEGLTFFGTDVAMAASYAHTYAPYAYKATPERPAYVIKVRKPADVKPDTRGEIGMPGALPASEIVEVYEGRVYAVQPANIDLVANSYSPADGYRSGSGYGGGTDIVWRRLDVAAAAAPAEPRPVRFRVSPGIANEIEMFENLDTVNTEEDILHFAQEWGNNAAAEQFVRAWVAARGRKRGDGSLDLELSPTATNWFTTRVLDNAIDIWEGNADVGYNARASRAFIRAGRSLMTKLQAAAARDETLSTGIDTAQARAQLDRVELQQIIDGEHRRVHLGNTGTIERAHEAGWSDTEVLQVAREFTDALDDYDEVLQDPRFQRVLRWGRDGRLADSAAEGLLNLGTKRVGMTLLRDDNQSRDGWGVTDLNATSARVDTRRPGVRTADTRDERIGSEWAADPRYTAIHEAHHMHGSRTEFDLGSEVAFAYHVNKRGLTGAGPDSIKVEVVNRLIGGKAGVNSRASRAVRALFGDDLLDEWAQLPGSIYRDPFRRRVPPPVDNSIAGRVNDLNAVEGMEAKLAWLSEKRMEDVTGRSYVRPVAEGERVFMRINGESLVLQPDGSARVLDSMDDYLTRSEGIERDPLEFATREAGFRSLQDAASEIAFLDQATEMYRDADDAALLELQRTFSQLVHGNSLMGVTGAREALRDADMGRSTLTDQERSMHEGREARYREINTHVAMRKRSAKIAREKQAQREAAEKGVLTVSDEEFAEMLANAGDVYADAGYVGEYNPDLFRTSDLSGQPIRYYITLPDGRVAHPDELHESRRRGRLVVVHNVAAPLERPRYASDALSDGVKQRVRERGTVAVPEHGPSLAPPRRTAEEVRRAASIDGDAERLSSAVAVFSEALPIEHDVRYTEGMTDQEITPVVERPHPLTTITRRARPEHHAAWRLRRDATDARFTANASKQWDGDGNVIAQDNDLEATANTAELAASAAEARVGGRVFRYDSSQRAKLDAQIEKLAKAARKIGLDPPVVTDLGDETVEHRESEIVPEGEGEQRIYQYAMVSGSEPKIAGWDFLASLQNVEGMNFIRRMPGSDESINLDAFRDSEPVCDYCKTKRDRKMTYVVTNEEEGVKRVGSSCIRDFLGHGDPNAIAAYMERWQEMLAFSDEEDDEERGGGGGTRRLVPTEAYLTHVATMVRTNGWVSRSAMSGQATADEADSNYYHWSRQNTNKQGQPMWVEPTDADRERAKAALAWVREHIGAKVHQTSDASEFEHNMYVASRGEHVPERGSGYLAYVVVAHAKHEEREIERRKRAEVEADSKHVGSVGDRLNVRATVMSVFERDGDYGVTYITKLMDDDGNVYKWFGSSELERGKVYEGKFTIKKHDEFRGVKETVLTRPSGLGLYDPDAPPPAEKPTKVGQRVEVSVFSNRLGGDVTITVEKLKSGFAVEYEGQRDEEVYRTWKNAQEWGAEFAGEVKARRDWAAEKLAGLPEGTTIKGGWRNPHTTYRAATGGYAKVGDLIAVRPKRPGEYAPDSEWVIANPRGGEPTPEEVKWVPAEMLPNERDPENPHIGVTLPDGVTRWLPESDVYVRPSDVVRSEGIERPDFDAEWVAKYRAKPARSRGRTRASDVAGYELMLRDPDLSHEDRLRYSARILEIRGEQEKADAMRERAGLPRSEGIDLPKWQDTPQQKNALRTNSAARKVREMYPSGTHVIVTPGAGAEPRPGAMQGTVLRHVPGLNAQGGHLNVRWENGVVGKISPGSVRPTGPSVREQIAAAYDRGDSIMAMGARFGTDEQTIALISSVTGTSRKHLRDVMHAPEMPAPPPALLGMSDEEIRELGDADLLERERASLERLLDTPNRAAARRAKAINDQARAELDRRKIDWQGLTRSEGLEQQPTEPRLTARQQQILDMLPGPEGGTSPTGGTRAGLEASELAGPLGMTDRGVQQVLYALVDKGLVNYDEAGYYAREQPLPRVESEGLPLPDAPPLSNPASAARESYRIVSPVIGPDVGIRAQVPGAEMTTETLRDQQWGTRGDGFFGSGAYFASSADAIPSLARGRDLVGLDLSGKKLYMPPSEENADRLHRWLGDVNYYATHGGMEDDLLARDERTFNDPELQRLYGGEQEGSAIAERLARGAPYGLWRRVNPPMIAGVIEASRADLRAGRLDRDTPSTRIMRALGYDGVDTRHLPALDNSRFGSVLYRDPVFHEPVPVDEPPPEREPTLQRLTHEMLDGLIGGSEPGARGKVMDGVTYTPKLKRPVTALDFQERGEMWVGPRFYALSAAQRRNALVSEFAREIRKGVEDQEWFNDRSNWPDEVEGFDAEAVYEEAFDPVAPERRWSWLESPAGRGIIAEAIHQGFPVAPEVEQRLAHGGDPTPEPPEPPPAPDPDTNDAEFEQMLQQFRDTGRAYVAINVLSGDVKGMDLGFHRVEYDGSYNPPDEPVNVVYRRDVFRNFDTGQTVVVVSDNDAIISIDGTTASTNLPSNPAPGTAEHVAASVLEQPLRSARALLGEEGFQPGEKYGKWTRWVNPDGRAIVMRHDRKIDAAYPDVPTRQEVEWALSQFVQEDDFGGYRVGVNFADHHDALDDIDSGWTMSDFTPDPGGNVYTYRHEEKAAIRIRVASDGTVAQIGRPDLSDTLRIVSDNEYQQMLLARDEQADTAEAFAQTLVGLSRQQLYERREFQSGFGEELNRPYYHGVLGPVSGNQPGTAVYFNHGAGRSLTLEFDNAGFITSASGSEFSYPTGHEIGGGTSRGEEIADNLRGNPYPQDRRSFAYYLTSNGYELSSGSGGEGGAWERWIHPQRGDSILTEAAGPPLREGDPDWQAGTLSAIYATEDTPAVMLTRARGSRYRYHPEEMVGQPHTEVVAALNVSQYRKVSEALGGDPNVHEFSAQNGSEVLRYRWHVDTEGVIDKVGFPDPDNATAILTEEEFKAKRRAAASAQAEAQAKAAAEADLRRAARQEKIDARQAPVEIGEPGNATVRLMRSEHGFSVQSRKRVRYTKQEWAEKVAAKLGRPVSDLSERELGRPGFRGYSYVLRDSNGHTLSLRVDSLVPEGATWLGMPMSKSDGVISRVEWKPAKAVGRDRLPEGTFATSLDEMIADGLGRTDELGERYGAKVDVPTVITTSGKQDHSAHHEWNGTIVFGQGIAPAMKVAMDKVARGEPLTDEEAGDAYSAWHVYQHEINHGVNPLRSGEYGKNSPQVAMEESLTEELAHPLAIEWLKTMGPGGEQILQWAAANPRSYQRLGTYRRHRLNLRRALTEAGVPEDEWRETMTRMKFNMSQPERFQFLGRKIAEQTGSDEESGIRRVRSLLQPTKAGLHKTEGVGNDFQPLLDVTPDLEGIEPRASELTVQNGVASVNTNVEVPDPPPEWPAQTRYSVKGVDPKGDRVAVHVGNLGTQWIDAGRVRVPPMTVQPEWSTRRTFTVEADDEVLLKDGRIVRVTELIPTGYITDYRFRGIPRSEEEEGGEGLVFAYQQKDIVRKVEPLKEDDFGNSGREIVVGGRPVLVGDLLVGKPTPVGRWQGNRDREYHFIAKYGDTDRAGIYGYHDEQPRPLVSGMVLGEWNPDEPGRVLELVFPVEGLRRPTETMIAEAA